MDIKCEICDHILSGKPHEKSGRNIAALQGGDMLLCVSCNNILRETEYDSGYLQKIIDYLNKPKCEICGSIDNQPCLCIVIPEVLLKIRGVFCSKCEGMLYRFGEISATKIMEIERLIKVRKYLEKINE